MVDQFVNIPFPFWYYSYLADNADPSDWSSETGMAVADSEDTC